ncbi:MAG TPA: zf-HC2 domain-containing protein, partial [Solirubrobacteraceae bacterium]|nr:zf-HC2 domain-containing protein [Solirubrobacteraceae bacterium]
MSQPSEHLARADDAAAYVLGALDEVEASEFRAHADSCAICAAELERLRATAAVVPLLAPQLEAPRRLRRRVLAAAREEQPARTKARPSALRFGGRFELAGAGGLAVGLVIGVLVLGAHNPSTS